MDDVSAAAMAALPSQDEMLATALEVSGPRAGATAGDPVESDKRLYADDTTEIGIWSVTPGEFPAAKRGVGELMVILAGDATVIGDDGTEVELRPGTSLVQQDGWTGRWVVRETVVKQYVIWKAS